MLLFEEFMTLKSLEKVIETQHKITEYSKKNKGMKKLLSDTY